MSKRPPAPKTHELPITLNEFLKWYNQNMPENFPRATISLLNRFREEHSSLFKRGDSWSLDLHRKKIMDWLPRNGGIMKQ
jgi:hypothetical protein